MIAHRRPRRDNDDGGFALIFVLFVTTMVMAAVATTMVITTPNITNSKNSQDVSGALLAAQSGIDDAVAYLTNVPACRSETRICSQALGADSTKLVGTKYARPSLGTSQSFGWTTDATPTSEGYVRVRATGVEDGVKRYLVADLSLNPSILAYGYYTDYESQAPSFFDSYYSQRTIDLTNSTTYNAISTNYRGSNDSLPRTVTWNGAASSASTGYPDSVCAQHWYSDGSSSPGRGNAAHGSTWYESGTINNQNAYHGSSCDLVFTTGMTEDGPTYTRDAFLISNGTGSGPNFKQPVYTLWGYPNHNSPAAPSNAPFRGDTPTATVYKPAVATSDITLPKTIGTDGISDNSCVYYGPTRIKLNGDGTATVTSPETVTKNNGSDDGCYPTNLTSSGIVGFTVNYLTVGSGTMYVKNLNKPNNGWPTSSLKSTSSPSAGNEIFYLPVNASTVSADPSSSVTPSSCTSSNTYSAGTTATCAWTNLPNGTNVSATSKLGWTAYTTGANCNSGIAATDRQLFECEYSKNTSATKPSGDQYASFRTLVQNYLAGGTCATGSISDQQTCIVNGLNTGVFPQANTGQHAYNYGSAAPGDHQYYATSSVGTATNTTKSLGGAPANPTSGDSLFTFNGTAGQERSTQTPITVTVCRQVKGAATTPANGSCGTGTSGWGAGVPQFTFTITHTDWTVTQQPTGASYFPNPNDVTTYATGSDSSGNAMGSNGPAQPGDLYVEGVNKGALSLIADNNVELTGNITNSSGDTSASDPLSITAGLDIHNYHPVKCVDQAAADINATTAGFCPNDITGLSSTSSLNSDGSFTSTHPAAQYSNMPTTSSDANGIGDRTIDAALFTLTGSLRTDNYDRGNWVGNLNVYGGIYQSHRGANGVSYGNGSNPPGRSGTSLQYHYVDLQRAHLPYAPAASYSNNPRVWNVVSISAGAPPAGS